TTGAGNDIERATDIARRMVCEWGMSDVLGPLTFGQKEEQIFLGRELTQHRDYSEQTAQMIDREVRDIVERNYQRARKIVGDNLQILHGLAAALLEFETLDSAEVDTIVNGGKVVRPEKPVGKPQDPTASAPVATEPKKGTSGTGPATAPV